MWPISLFANEAENKAKLEMWGRQALLTSFPGGTNIDDLERP